MLFLTPLGEIGLFLVGCSAVPGMESLAAVAHDDAIVIPHSPAETARMDSNMEGLVDRGLVDPLLNWNKIVRFAPQPKFERWNGQLRLVARETQLETYAPFFVIRLEAIDSVYSELQVTSTTSRVGRNPCNQNEVCLCLLR